MTVNEIDSGVSISETLNHRATMLKSTGEVLAFLNAHWVHAATGMIQPEKLREHIGRSEDLIRNLSGMLIDQDRRLFSAVTLAGELRKIADDAHETIRQMTEVIGQHEATVEFLTNDRMAIVAERNEAQEEVRDLKAKIKVASEHSSSSKEATLAIEAAIADVRLVLKPSNIDALQKRDLASLTAIEAAELALWETTIERGRLIRFIACLATMTDIEVEFLDASLLREQARLLTMGEPATLSPTYGEEDRKRAIRTIWGRVPGTSGDAGEVVDAVAEALGMRRAGE